MLSHDPHDRQVRNPGSAAGVVQKARSGAGF
jgi:hypothetical protein